MIPPPAVALRAPVVAIKEAPVPKLKVMAEDLSVFPRREARMRGMRRLYRAPAPFAGNKLLGEHPQQRNEKKARWRESLAAEPAVAAVNDDSLYDDVEPTDDPNEVSPLFRVSATAFQSNDLGEGDDDSRVKEDEEDDGSDQQDSDRFSVPD